MNPTRRRQVHRGRRTTRRRQADAALSVETLQAAFEKIDRRVRTLVEKRRSDAQVAECIRKSWKDILHTQLSGPATRGLLTHYRTVQHPKGRTRKIQRGGMAPLDWTLGQGTTAPIYGRFPVEMGAQASVVKSLDEFYEHPISRSCNATGGYPAPAQTGGGFFDALANGHAPASVPRNILETTVSAIQGNPITNPPPSPVAAQIPAGSVALKPFDP